MTDSTRQFLRKASLVLVEGEQGLDISDMHFRFRIAAADTESPNNAEIRVWNLSADTVKKIRGEYSTVVVQAGYEGNFGVVFKGNIKQFRLGRENATDTYLDILAADGDMSYVNAVVSTSLAAGSTPSDRVKALDGAFNKYGVKVGKDLTSYTGGVLPRGKVLFGMARDFMRDHVQSWGSTWSINGGEIQILPLQGYLPDEALVLNSTTGLIGRPEATQDGVKVRSLLNPRLVTGGLLKIDQESINRVLQQNPAGAPVPYNQWAGLQLLADTTSDGVYRIYVSEHSGDTRGQEWYTDMVCLAVDLSAQKVKANG